MIQKLKHMYYICIICVRTVSYQKGQPRWKNRFQKQSFADLKLGVLKNFVNSTGKHLCRSLFLIKLQTSCNSIKRRLQYRCFPVKFVKFLKAPFLEKRSSGCFLGLSRVFKGVRSKNRATVSNIYQIQLKKSICWRKNLEAAPVGVL